MHNPLHGKVVVITGASSGIGRATAEAFAKKGACLVLASRREQALHEAAEACEDLGAEAARIFPLDVTEEGEVRELAFRTHEEFGRIDVWVNAAAVTAFGRFDETPSEVFRRVIDTNLFGYIHGARAALPYLEEHGGVLVNVGSLVSEMPQPYASPYVISKHGIHALGRCLRQELRLMGLEGKVHVVDVMPATFDTPLFENAANYTGYAARALPPVNAPKQVARAIVKAARAPRDEIHVGRASGAVWAARLAPRYTERRAAKRVHRKHLDWTRPAPHDAGNVFVPRDQRSRVTGGWRKGTRARKAGLWLAPVALLGVIGAVLGMRARDRAPVEVRTYEDTSGIPDFS